MHLPPRTHRPHFPHRPAPYKLTEEGFENHLVTNYLGHYLLTLLLLPSLEQATNQARAGWGGTCNFA